MKNYVFIVMFLAMTIAPGCASIQKMADDGVNPTTPPAASQANARAGIPDKGSPADQIANTAVIVGKQLSVFHPVTEPLGSIIGMGILAAFGASRQWKYAKEKQKRREAQQVIQAVNESKDTPSVIEQVSDALKPIARKALLK